MILLMFVVHALLFVVSAALFIVGVYSGNGSSAFWGGLCAAVNGLALLAWLDELRW